MWQSLLRAIGKPIVCNCISVGKGLKSLVVKKSNLFYVDCRSRAVCIAKGGL